MRRTLILTLAVLAAALSVCAGSLLALNDTVDRADALRSLAVLAVEEGAPSQAKARMVALAGLWEERAPLLQTLADHDALHEVSSAIAEAQICLECEDHDDFLRTMSGVAAALNHLKDEEAVCWSNLY